MNAGSVAQVQQLMFAGVSYRNRKEEKRVEDERFFKVCLYLCAQLPLSCPAARVASTTNALAALQVPNQLPEDPSGKRRTKFMDICLHGVWGRGKPSPLQPVIFTPAGACRLQRARGTRLSVVLIIFNPHAAFCTQILAHGCTLSSVQERRLAAHLFSRSWLGRLARRGPCSLSWKETPKKVRPCAYILLVFSEHSDACVTEI